LKYAFGIIQNKNCWCSNLIPHRDDRKPLEDCEDPCPGFPTDFCGGDGVFAYLEAAGATPTGTAPPGGTATKSPSSTTTSESVSKPPAVTTITVGGNVRTVTAPSEPTATDDSSVVDNPGSSLQPGAIAGIVIGVIGGLAVIALAIWFCFFKRRRENEEANGLGSPMRGGGSPGRMATPKSGEVSENRFAGTPGGSVAATWDSQNKRRSHLMPVDPRLDPFATGIYPDQNRSRESFNSLQDNQDYSRRVHQPPRVLRAMNPDPDD
jgi:cell wall integrity and stress response component